MLACTSQPSRPTAGSPSRDVGSRVRCGVHVARIKTMDLKLIEATEDAATFDYEVINPKNQQTLMTLTLAGPTHAARVALNRKYERKLSGNIKRSQDARRAITAVMTEALD